MLFTTKTAQRVSPKRERRRKPPAKLPASPESNLARVGPDLRSLRLQKKNDFASPGGQGPVEPASRLPVEATGRSRGIQRYISGEKWGLGLPAGYRISDTGVIVILSPQELYATQDKIDEANKALAKSGGVLLEKGPRYDLKGPFGEYQEGAKIVLYTVNPVLKEPESKKLGALGFVDELNVGVKAGQKPSKSDLQKKEVAYGSFIKRVSKRILALSVQLGDLLKDLGAGKFKLSDALSGPMQKKVVDLLKDWMGSDAFVAQYIDNARLGWALIEKPTIEDLLKFVGAIKDTARNLEKTELASSEQGKLILPSDCFTAAMVVTAGKTSKTNKDPGIGENHFVDFKGQGTGWVNHWAGVIMKDGKDTVTLENAADPTKAPIDRTSWYFGMYGTRIKGQSFQEEYWRKHKERSAKFGKPIKDD